MNELNNQEKIEREFKGVWISKEIWLDERLNALDKIIFTEIDSLCNDEDGCYASNEYIAKFCQCSLSKVSHSISKLINYGYLYVLKFDGRKRYLQVSLAKNNNQPCKICKADSQNLQDINIDNNIDNNNLLLLNRIHKLESEINKYKNTNAPTLEDIKEYAKLIKSDIDYEYFFNYYEANRWLDKNGEPIENWKLAFLFWEKNEKEKKKKEADENKPTNYEYIYNKDGSVGAIYLNPKA